MKYIINLLYMCCSILAVAGCTNTNTNEKKIDTNNLTSFPEEVYVRLLKECDYVDIMFFDNPVSMSQSDDAGIQSTLTYITRQVARINPDCKPMGRISYMIKGEIIADGNFYCSDGCSYIVFEEEGKPKYANELSTNGVQFFQNILAQIQRQLDQQ
jgi:hypothetical protein